MITIQQLDYRYRSHQPIYQQFNWSVTAGEHWTILGPSGCGKTTLLKLLAGLYQPDGGRILVDGRRLTRPRPNTGLILQNYGLLPWSNVWQNVALGLKIRKFYGRDGIHTPGDGTIPTRKERHQIVEHWLRRLGLWEQRRQYPGQLSGGQRQRVAIARTFALQPDLLLMDEPFNSLDAPTRERLQDLVLELRAEMNMTTIIVTHAIDEAAVLGSRILVLHDPPNREPHIIDNPEAEAADYRTRPAYLAMRNHLRDVMGLAI